MPDNRVQATLGGFALMNNARFNARQQDLLEKQNKQEQAQQFRERIDTGIAESMRLLQESAQKQSASAFSADSPEGKQQAVEVQTRTAQGLWKSTQQALEMGKQQGLYTDQEIATIKQQFRTAATLRDPVAEKRLESEITQKREIAVSAAQKGQSARIVPENKKFVNFINPETQDRKSAREGSSEAAQLAESGYLRDVRSEGDVGLTGGQEGKAILGIAEERIVAENFDDSLGQIQDFVRSENYVGGITGTGLQLINSAAQQFAQMTGTETLFTGTELNIEHIDEELSDENVGFLRRAAISGDVREAAKARLAYILAKQLDPNGRISNADVENAENILSGSADRQSTLLTLQNLRDTSEREFNTRARIMEQTIKNTADPFRKLEKNRKPGSKKDVSKMTDEELFQ